MGLFGFGKKREEVVDYTRQYKKQQKNVSQTQTTPQAEENPMGFLGDIASTAAMNSQQEEYNNSDNPEDKRRKLARRLSDMTSRIEDLSNQIYRLSQRVELIERKLDVNRE
ncbi:MAG: hypothetical protein AABW81_03815 [Nanoarchaeota archaeon]